MSVCQRCGELKKKYDFSAGPGKPGEGMAPTPDQDYGGGSASKMAFVGLQDLYKRVQEDAGKDKLLSAVQSTASNTKRIADILYKNGPPEGVTPEGAGDRAAPDPV